jgi:single-strand DNA-binding protein
MSLLVEGRLVIRSYETKEGEKRKAIEVVASDVQMLDRKSTGAGSSSSAVHLPGNEDEDLDGGFIPF